MKEIWKTIEGHSNYQISNCGRVKSLTRYVKHPKGGLKIVRERILRPTKFSNGYFIVNLGTNKEAFSVHRLIAKTFLVNPLNKPCVNHLDGNKTNNNIDNLQWCSYSENEKWSYDKLGKKANKSMLGRRGEKSPLFKPVGMFDLLSGELLKVFAGVNECGRIFNKSVGDIANVCRGEQKTAYGYKFRYITKELYEKIRPTRNLA